ncbi:MAG TPA: hypothetical protein VIH59_02535, partial [Candidatus Tectomicrobia bacterium]
MSPSWSKTSVLALPFKPMTTYARASLTSCLSDPVRPGKDRATPRNGWAGVGLIVLVWLCILTNVAHSDTTPAETSRPLPPTSHSQEAVPPLAVHPTIVHGAGYLAPATQVLGTIFHVVEERQSTADGDHVVIDAGSDKNLHSGDRVTIIRTSTARSHTITQPTLGPLTAILGTGTVVSVQPTTAVVRIDRAFDTIERGNQVKASEPLQPLVVSASRMSQGRRDMAGFIVATKDNKVIVGTGDIVYLDQGKQQGVEVGDRFDILQESRIVQHPTTQRMVRLPKQILGALTVLNVHDHTSTGLITASQQEFSTGTPVEWRSDTALAAVSQTPDASLSRQAELMS